MPKFNQPRPRWEYEETAGGPPSFLPAGIDKTGWKDITTVSDLWRRYLTPSGKVVDCADYYAAYLKEAKDATN